jgi:hypothetical protein
LRRVTSALGLALALTAVANAESPSIASLDAEARASGNRPEVAEQLGSVLFLTRWPAQVLKVAADGVGSHLVVGLLISGVKFHHPLTREQFILEVGSLITLTLRRTPTEEVDAWVAVPMNVGKGVIVSGDLAHPTSRVVFTISVRRAESPAMALARMRAGRDVYWDEDWARTAFKQGV